MASEPTKQHCDRQCCTGVDRLRFFGYICMPQYLFRFFGYNYIFRTVDSRRDLHANYGIFNKSDDIFVMQYCSKRKLFFEIYQNFDGSCARHFLLKHTNFVEKCIYFLKQYTINSNFIFSGNSIILCALLEASRTFWKFHL